jgi:hypothetical protein
MLEASPELTDAERNLSKGNRPAPTQMFAGLRHAQSSAKIFALNDDETLLSVKADRVPGYAPV